ncbi:hypothetical protein BN2475_150067 [Paraburkholderia ribeironis]|uniref:Uncharacterized protein n=1 Tax=Paraburkholderia ribeironis TaxID=1247936 RepID=A0A1N7RTE5_9BURK|nr:hypothetical protein BN2475_150067 [Paraburkholderia ribeironis]
MGGGAQAEAAYAVGSSPMVLVSGAAPRGAPPALSVHASVAGS